MPGVPSSEVLNSPNAARIYDYALGGHHNFAVDREFAERMWADTGYSPLIYRLNRSFLRRAVRFMLARGVDQFLDLGSGIPTVGNVHEIAHGSAPEAHVVYVDNEPVAAAHARRLLSNTRNATVVEADLRDVDSVLAHGETSGLLNLTRPVGLLMVAVLHFLPDGDDPAGIVARYRRALAAGGGYLALSHVTADGRQRGDARGGVEWYRQTTTPLLTRDAEEVRAILAGLELVEPGLVWTPLWRPDEGDHVPDMIEDSGVYAAVGVLGDTPGPAR